MTTASRKHEIHALLTETHHALVAELREQTGADSGPVVAAARVLVRTMKRRVGVAGGATRVAIKTRKAYGGTPSAAGESPRKQSARLQKSIGTAVVEGIRRVGTSDFVGRLLEYGVVATTKPRRKKRASGHLETRAHVQTSHRLVIQPRPWARVAVEEAKGEMTDVLVGELQKRTAT